MTEPNKPNSDTELLHHVKRGDKPAAERLFARYFDRVIRAARRRINSRRLRGTGSEDIAASVFESLWKKAENQEFSEHQLISSDEFWRFLSHLVRSKTENHLRYEHAQKRGGGRVHGESVLTKPEEKNERLGTQAVTEMTPFEVAVFRDEHEHFMRILDDETLQEIVTLRMEGRTLNEIAETFEKSDRWVKRKLSLIRQIWLTSQQPNSE